MPEAFDAGPAADMLVRAWRAGSLLSDLPEKVRPRTMAEGYDVQDAVIEALGLPVSGWKLGVGSAALKRLSGVGRSIAGRILSCGVYRDGDTVHLPNAAPVTVEFEIAYVLGRDVVPTERPFPVLEAVSEVRAAFELVLSRFVDRRAVGWPSFAADNGAFLALVLGDPVAREDLDALAESLVVSHDGRERARRVDGEDATDPVGALADLVTLARERSMTLTKGSVVSTGTLSRPFNVAEGPAEIQAAFLGRTLGFKTTVDRRNCASH